MTIREQQRSAPAEQQTCHQCRHHSKTRRPRLVPHALESLMDTLVEFDDADEVVYFCRAPSSGSRFTTSGPGVVSDATGALTSPYAGKEVGPVPVHCDAFQGVAAGAVAGAGAGTSASLDAALARAAERAAERERRDAREGR